MLIDVSIEVSKLHLIELKCIIQIAGQDLAYFLPESKYKISAFSYITVIW